MRDERAARTRERILEALFEEIAEPPRISLPKVARRARVAVPTIYRHFRNEAALSQAAARHFEAKVPVAQGPATLEGLIRLMPTLYLHFDQHERLMRSRFLMSAIPGFRARLLRRVAQRIRSMVDESLPQAGPADRIRLAALLRVLSSAHAWELLRDGFGLRGREAGALVGWAMRELLKAMNQEGRIPA